MATNFRHTVILLILTILLALQAQDSLNTSNQNPFLPSILPLSLITAGCAISGSGFEKDLQADIRHAAGEDFSFKADDYLAHVPMAEIYIFDLMGIKAENRFYERSKNVFLANLSSQIIVQSLKYTTDKLRPDGEDRESFPSNHTNIAFTNAAVLFHEYKNSNSFIAYGGFGFAAATGALRILNNKHWTGDVLAGAGIGMLCADLVYRFEPFKRIDSTDRNDKMIAIIPDFGVGSYGIKITAVF